MDPEPPLGRASYDFLEEGGRAMLRRTAAIFALVFCVLIGPFGLGCGSKPAAGPASTSSAEEEVEVPTVELPDTPEDQSQDSIGE
jgi:hypothetical protein